MTADPFRCSVCRRDIAAAGCSIDGVRYCPDHRPRDDAPPPPRQLDLGLSA